MKNSYILLTVALVLALGTVLNADMTIRKSGSLFLTIDSGGNVRESGRLVGRIEANGKIRA